MPELRYNNQFGTLGQNLDAPAAGTSEALPNLFSTPPNFATISGGDYVTLVLDGGTGSFEISHLTGYTAGSVGGIVTRGAEDATHWPPVTHNVSTGTWGNNPTLPEYPTMYNVVDFGATGNGTTDDTTAINSAIAAASVAGGGVVWFPAGKYLASSTFTIPSNVSVCGAGQGVEIYAATDYGHVFVFSVGAQYARVSNLGIQYSTVASSSASTSSTHAAVAFTIATSGAQLTQGVIVEDLNITGFSYGVLMPWADGTSVNYAQYYQVTLNRLQTQSCKLGVFLTGFSDSTISNILVGNTFGSAQVSGLQGHTCPPSSGATPSTTYGSTFQNLINEQGNSTIEKFEVYGGLGDGLVLQDCCYTKVHNVETGSLTGNGFTLNGGTTILIEGGHSGLCTINGFYCQDSSQMTLTHITFIQCDADANGNDGCKITKNSLAVQNFDFVGCTFVSNDNNGIDSAASYVTIVGGAIGISPQIVGLNPNYTGASCYAIFGTDFTGNSYTPIYANGYGAPLIAINCGAVNDLAFDQYTPGVPATGIGNAVENFDPYNVRIYMPTFAGAVHIIDRFANDFTLPQNPSYVTLGPQESIYFVTAAPASWTWYGE